MMAGGGGGGGDQLNVHPSCCSPNAAASSSSSSSSTCREHPFFRVLCKGMVMTYDYEVLGLGDDKDPDSVLVVAVCRPRGEVVLRGHKPVLGLVVDLDDDDDDDNNAQVLLEAMALVEGLLTVIRMGIVRVKALIEHRLLHNYMLGLSRPTWKKLADLINQALSLQKQFEQCEIVLLMKGQVKNAVKLPKEALDVEIAKYLAATKDQRESFDDNVVDTRETCRICFNNVDTTKIHTVEGCSHRFCLPCMNKHMKVMLLHGVAPRCPQPRCTTKLTVEEGSKVLLPSLLLQVMAQRLEEEQIHPSQRIYCPYPKCSALMSLSGVQAGSSCSDDYTAHNNDAETLRKCVKCGEPICVNCKVAWHEGMSCLEYQRQYPNGGPEDERLQNLARERLWKRCERCNHMIELIMGCAHVTCVCGNTLCYICGKTLAEDGSCACTGRRRRWCFPLPACLGGMCR